MRGDREVAVARRVVAEPPDGQPRGPGIRSPANAANGADGIERREAVAAHVGERRAGQVVGGRRKVARVLETPA